MAASALHNPLPSLRMWLAEITRSGGNPNHDAQGRFAPGAGKPVPDVVVQQGETGGKYARLIARAERGETFHRQCAHCSRMLNGPYAGKRLGVVVRKDDWSHGMCLKCHHDVLYDYYTKRWGMTSEQAERRIALQQAGEPIPDDLLTGAEKEQSNTTQRLRAIRMLVAQVMRNATWTDAHGNTWEVIQGAGGKFVQVILLSHGPGQEHVAPPIGTKLGVHEAARMLREKEGRPEEVQPARALEPTKIASAYGLNFSSGAEYIPYLAAGYGEHGLGVALHGYSIAQLRRFADDLHIDTKGIRNNKASLVTAIVAHVTRDEATGIPRYSADFGKSASGKAGGLKGEGAAKALPPRKTPEQKAADHAAQIQQALEDWRNNRAYIGGDGQYRIKGAYTSSGRATIAPWNKAAKLEFPDVDALHRASHQQRYIPKVVFSRPKPTPSGKRTGATKGSTTKTAGAGKARAQRDQEITAGLAAAQRYREASAQREQILRDLEVAKRDHPYDTHFADVFKEARHFADVVATRRQALAAMNKVARSLSQDERAMLRQRIQNHPSYYTPKEQSIDDLLHAASSQDTKRIVRESKKGVSQRVAIPTLAAIRATLHSIA